MTSRFAGKRVVVSGGANGMGLAAAARFRIEGAEVLIVDRVSPSPADLAEAGLQAADVSVVIADLGEQEEISRAHQAIRDRFGSVDVLYNHAGIVRVRPFLDTSYADWLEVLRVNVLSMVEMSKGVIPMMQAAGGGSIVNMASLSGRIASPLESAYCVSKAAVAQLTKAIAVEFRCFGIRCNCVSPAMVDTRHGRQEMRDLVDAGVPMDGAAIAEGQVRLARPEEVASAVLYLASEDASFVTGTELVIDNGWSAGA